MADQKNKNVDKNVKLESENLVLEINKELPKRKSYKVLVFSSFVQRLKEDKLYLICFVITIFAFVIFSINKVKGAEGAFAKKEETIVENNHTNNINNNDKLDVTDYVGIYVKSYKLDKKIKYGDSCEIASYDFVYEIKSDNSIQRYIVNKCFGTILLNTDVLGYVNSGKDRNIGSKSAIYVFNGNKLSEIDGLSYIKNTKYKLDDTITKLVNSNLTFYGDRFIVLNNNNLYLVNGDSVIYELDPKTLLSKSIYKTSSNTYRYFVYSDDETEVCYESINVSDVAFEDKDIYSIYSIEFDETNLLFKDSVLEITRKRSDTCAVLDDDMTRYND